MSEIDWKTNIMWISILFCFALMTMYYNERSYQTYFNEHQELKCLTHNIENSNQFTYQGESQLYYRLKIEDFNNCWNITPYKYNTFFIKP